MSLWALIAKDARRELRGKDAFQAGLVLVLMFLVLDLFVASDLSDQPALAALVLWTPVLYGAIVVTGRSLAAEADRGTLELLRVAPVPLLWHGLSRTLVNGILVCALVAVALAAAWAVFLIPISASLVAVLALSAVGLTVVGSLTGGLAAQARSRDVLLPVLAVPVLVPLLQAGAEGTLAALDGAALAGLQTHLLLLASYDLLALGAAWFLWPAILEA